MTLDVQIYIHGTDQGQVDRSMIVWPWWFIY